MPRLSQTAPVYRRELVPVWTADIGDWATSLSFSHDGRTCAAGAASGIVKVFDANQAACLFELDAHPGGVLDIAFSPNKRRLVTSGQDGTAKLWDVDTGRVIAMMPGVGSWVEHVVWSPDGKTIATASGKVVRLWSSRGEPIVETELHESTVTGIAFSRRGTDLATSCYGGIRIFKIAQGKSKHHAWKGSLISLAWSPDDRVIACGAQDCSIHFWRLPSGNDSFMQGYRSKPKALSWSSDSTLLATSGESIVTVWDFAGRGPEGTDPLMLSSHLDLITDLSFQSRGTRLVSGGKDAGVIVWEPRKSLEPLAFAFLRGEISKVAFRPHHDQVIATDASGAIACWALPQTEFGS